jgi:iron complex outermembrane receptor protein
VLSALLPAWSAAAPASEPGTAAGALEEVIVTARKREERIGTTPIAVTAFTEAALASRGIDTLTDLGRQVANLSIISGQGGGSTQTQISIRGVGQSDFILTSDQSVGVYVDGVYIPRSLGAALDLIDIQRVEVLRGPQGTLFGRNTTAGAVQILSTPPEDHLAGKMELTTGSFDRADFKGSINLPLAGGAVLSRFSIASLNQDGYGERLAQDSDGSNVRLLAARAQFRANPSPTLQADLTIDGSRKRGHAGLETLVAVDTSNPFLAPYNAFLESQGLPPFDERWITSDPHDTWAGQRNRDENDILGAALTLDWTLGAAKLKSITAYRQLRAVSGYSFSASPYPVSEQELNLDQNQWSEELQLTGLAFDERLDWIAGLFYFREKASDYQNVPFYQPVIATGDGGFVRVPGGFSFASYISQKTDSYAAFGQATWKFTERLSGTVGARFTSEKKTLYSYLVGAFARPPGTVDKSWSDVSPRLGLEYRFTPEWFGYASVSRGFRSGGFNGRNTTPLPPDAYDPEKITAWELGLKHESASRRWRLNTAAYYYDYSDFQGLTLSSFSGITITVGNIADVKLWGAEFDLIAKPVERLELGLSAGYAHQDIAHVDPGAQITINSNTRLVNSPEWTGTASVDLTAWRSSWGDLVLHADYSYKSSIEFFLPNYPTEGQPAYGLVNARVVLTPNDRPWSVEVFGNNLADEEYRVFAEDGTSLGVPATTAIYGRPREWGLRFKLRFD